MRRTVIFVLVWLSTRPLFAILDGLNLEPEQVTEPLTPAIESASATYESATSGRNSTWGQAAQINEATETVTETHEYVQQLSESGVIDEETKSEIEEILAGVLGTPPSPISSGAPTNSASGSRGTTNPDPTSSSTTPTASVPTFSGANAPNVMGTEIQPFLTIPLGSVPTSAGQSASSGVTPAPSPSSFTVFSSGSPTTADPFGDFSLNYNAPKSEGASGAAVEDSDDGVARGLASVASPAVEQSANNSAITAALKKSKAAQAAAAAAANKKKEKPKSASVPNASASGLQVVENPEIKHNESLRGKATDLIYRFGEFFEFWDASRDLGNWMNGAVSSKKSEPVATDLQRKVVLNERDIWLGGFVMALLLALSGGISYFLFKKLRARLHEAENRAPEQHFLDPRANTYKAHLSLEKGTNKKLVMILQYRKEDGKLVDTFRLRDGVIPAGWLGLQKAIEFGAASPDQGMKYLGGWNFEPTSNPVRVAVSPNFLNPVVQSAGSALP